MSREELIRVLKPFIQNAESDAQSNGKTAEMITKLDFYIDKLTGADNSAKRRDALAIVFGLPIGMTPNALLEALNIVTDKEGYRRAVDKIEQ